MHPISRDRLIRRPSAQVITALHIRSRWFWPICQNRNVFDVYVLDGWRCRFIWGSSCRVTTRQFNRSKVISFDTELMRLSEVVGLTDAELLHLASQTNLWWGSEVQSIAERRRIYLLAIIDNQDGLGICPSLLW